ncbi:MAG TPA: LytTR family DNA-binding domain-containing protein [Rudaea sp.]
MSATPTALIADDEPLLRDALTRQLKAAWPALTIVAQARNGREAVERFEQHRPDICFLDVHMPGLTGLDAARRIGRRAHVVFVTAYDQYAVQAFAQGVLDYLVKPVDAARLADTVARLQERLAAALPAPNTDQLIRQLSQLIERRPQETLRWIRAQVGQTLRMIAVEDIDYLRSDAKYTVVGWRADGGKPAEAVVRTALKDLLAQLDATQFVQVHRSAVVNLRAVRHVTRSDDAALIHLKGRDEQLPVSRSYLHLFRQM